MFGSGKGSRTSNSGYEGVAEFYDLFADNSDIPFYLDYARKTGGPVLDIASGTGRVALELARNGFEVVALEKSPSMLMVAREKLKAQSADIAARVSILEGSMASFHIDREFNLIIIPSSFGHAITTEEQLSTLQCIKNHLSPEGFFILDLFPGRKNLQPADFQDSPARLTDGRVVQRVGTLSPDIFEQMLHVGLTFEIKPADGADSECIEVESRVAIIFDREADLLVRMAGFTIVDEFGSFRCDSYDSESDRRILILKHIECPP